MWFMGLLAVLYLCFLKTEGSRIKTQRLALARIRKYLARKWNWTKLESLVREGEDNLLDSEFGFKVLVSSYIFILYVLALLLILEGKATIGINVSGHALFFTVCLYRNVSKKSMVNFARCFILHGIYFIWQGTQLGQLHFRRSLMVRAIMNAIWFESLEESFLHLMGISVMLGGVHRHDAACYYALPVQLFFFCNLPLQIMGVSEWLSLQASLQTTQLFAFKSKRFLSGMHFFTSLVPICIIYATFSASQVRASVYLWQAIICLGAGLALSSPWLGKKFDSYVSPTVVALGKDALSQAPPARMVFGNQSRAEDWGNKLHASRHVNNIAILVCMWFQLHFATLALLMLRVVQVSADPRTCSHVQRDTLLILAALLLISSLQADEDILWCTRLAIALTLFSILISQFIASCRELAVSKIKDEQDADNFVNHAIKQKLAALGSFVEHLLYEVQQQTYIDQAQTCAILTHVLREIRIGHNRCAATTLSRLMETGRNQTRLARIRHGELKSHLLSLHFAREFMPQSDIVFQNDHETFGHEVAIELDWEVFDLCMYEWILGGGKLVKLTTEKLGKEVEISLELDRVSIHPTFLSVMRTLGASIQGEFQGNTFTFRAKQLAVSPGSTKISSLSGSLEREYIVLQRLTFALLDDTALIRRNFECILNKTVRVPKLNIFTRGGTAQECKFFAFEICSKQVDIAIFDQNLDYDDEFIKGVDVARQALTNGFRGCLILHTSDANISQLLSRNAGLFHGVIEKSADKQRFLEGVQHAWQNYQTSVYVN